MKFVVGFAPAGGAGTSIPDGSTLRTTPVLQPMSSSESGLLLRGDLERWRPVVRAFGLTSDE